MTQQVYDSSNKVKEDSPTEERISSIFVREGNQGEGSGSYTNVPMMPPQQPNWEQFLQRFDTFERTITSTIQEEIRVNTVGLQNEVRSLRSRIDQVEKSSTSNETRLSNIEKKVTT